MTISATTKICMIIGDPVSHSLSPAMHNAAYEQLDIADQFVFLAAAVTLENTAMALQAVRTLGIRGLTCTAPHKQAVIPYLDGLDTVAEKIGAVNTIVNDGTRLIGYNTDWLGIVAPLEKHLKLAGLSVAVIGAGGAARAAVYGLTERGAQVTVYNRTSEKAAALAATFGCRSASLAELAKASAATAIIDTTASKGESLVPARLLAGKPLIFDITYAPEKTNLLAAAQAHGCKTIDGLEMLLYQGMAQFELYTGQTAPEAAMRKALLQGVVHD